jgi:error-prone DNA polymerase
VAYVELHCHSAYSFLDGASHPEELALRAAELGYEALALTDHEGVYGSLELAHAAKLVGVRPITGAEVTLHGGRARDRARRVVAGLRESLPLADRGPRAHAAQGRRACRPRSTFGLLAELNEGLVCLRAARDGPRRARSERGRRSPARSGGSASTSSCSVRSSAATPGGTRFSATSPHRGVETVVTGNVHAHDPAAHRAPGRARRDPTTPRSSRASASGAATARASCAPAELLELFPDDRDAVLRTAEVAARLEFDLTQELGYRYPDFSDGRRPAIQQLAQVCDDAFSERYPPSNRLLLSRLRARLEQELRLIDELGLAGFFLLHWEGGAGADLANGIRGPGRRDDGCRRAGAGARRWIDRLLPDRSHVDPVAQNSLARPLRPRELMSAPDIDLDFPRDIREQLILGVTERYGREHASPRRQLLHLPSPRGAIRDVGKALGLPFAELERPARVSDGWNAKRVAEESPLPEPTGVCSPRWRARRADARSPGLPRHISQHPAGW